MDEGVATILVSIATYLVMVAGYYLHRYRRLHVSIMGFIIAYDLAMPVYLYLYRDFYERLIVQGDILTFGIWMHFGCIVVLYVLYTFQVLTGLQLWRRDPKAPRGEHRSQAKGLLVARALVIFTGALLYEFQ